jgi:hypothetical protein
MRFRRDDDDCVVGIGGEHFYRKGEPYDLTDLGEIAQALAPLSGWTLLDEMAAPEGTTEPDDDAIEPDDGIGFDSASAEPPTEPAG